MSIGKKQENARAPAIENRFYQAVTKISAIEGDRMAIEWFWKIDIINQLHFYRQNRQEKAIISQQNGDRNGDRKWHKKSRYRTKNQ